MKTLTLLLSTATILSLMTDILAQPNVARVLIYSATRDFRHDSIPTAVDALVAHGPTANITFDHTEDETWFTDDRLQQYDGIVFLSNTGEVLNEAEKAAFQRWLDLGGNLIGIHSASDCLRNTTFFQHELGAAFDYHPELQNATVDVIGPSHPSTSMLPKEWAVRDEMYNFKSDPRSVGAVVILSANESSYTDPGPRKFDQGTPHPTAWFQEHGAGVDSNGTAGRSFYTSLGHLNETWQDDLFMAHVMGGITWALQSNTTLAFNSSGKVGNGTTANASSSSASTTASGTGTGSVSSTSPTAGGSSAAPPPLLSARALSAIGGFVLAISLWTLL
ncbi:class I glutamine amidotransferase-like protein [Trametes coccinea BRFM310]|uniref:Class I glutamine amidotransferase-like protein n=1 Tax=Trametes coccinea (strain BRFM310) TaxID=1353009 RepID=A0A1Y2IFN3_TRAC3|nr:class I glutamine amidotransferase-like protein [Trametes coccinea BRFM310]